MLASYCLEECPCIPVKNVILRPQCLRRSLCDGGGERWCWKGESVRLLAELSRGGTPLPPITLMKVRNHQWSDHFIRRTKRIRMLKMYMVVLFIGRCKRAGFWRILNWRGFLFKVVGNPRSFRVICLHYNVFTGFFDHTYHYGKNEWTTRGYNPARIVSQLTMGNPCTLCEPSLSFLSEWAMMWKGEEGVLNNRPRRGGAYTRPRLSWKLKISDGSLASYSISLNSFSCIFWVVVRGSWNIIYLHFNPTYIWQNILIEFNQ